MSGLWICGLWCAVDARGGGKKGGGGDGQEVDAHVWLLIRGKEVDVAPVSISKYEYASDGQFQAGSGPWCGMGDASLWDSFVG